MRLSSSSRNGVGFIFNIIVDVKLYSLGSEFLIKNCVLGRVNNLMLYCNKFRNEKS